MASATKHTPFTFDVSFDSPSAKQIKEEEERIAREAEEEARLNPPAPTFSEEELVSAKATAWEEGHQAGIEEATQAIEAQVVGMLETLTAQLAVLHDKQALANETQAADLARITAEILQRLLPAYAKRHGPDEIVALVADCIAPLLDEGRITIRVPTIFKEHLEPRLRSCADEAGFEGRLLVFGEDSYAPADARVEWGAGGAERKWDEVWAPIEEAVQHAINQVGGNEGENTPAAETAPPPAPEPEPEMAVAEPEPMPSPEPQPVEAEMPASEAAEEIPDLAAEMPPEADTAPEPDLQSEPVEVETMDAIPLDPDQADPQVAGVLEPEDEQGTEA